MTEIVTVNKKQICNVAFINVISKFVIKMYLKVLSECLFASEAPGILADAIVCPWCKILQPTLMFSNKRRICLKEAYPRGAEFK